MHKILLSVTGILLCGLAAGQTPAPPRLTLEQAAALAIKNHPQVATARNVAAAAGQHVVEAKSSYYPTIAAEITGTQANDLSRIGAGLLQADRKSTRLNSSHLGIS